MVVVALVASYSVPVLAAEVGAQMDGALMMFTPADSDAEGENWFMSPSDESFLWAKADMGSNVTGYMKLVMNIMNDNQITGSGYNWVTIDQMWVKKAGAFGQEALGMMFGEFDVPCNLNINNGMTDAITGENPFVGPLAPLFSAWGLNISYDLGEGTGVINLTTFEGTEGQDSVDFTDLDSGLFASIALNYDSRENAFGVNGLRVVGGYASVAPAVADGDGMTVISLGGTYSALMGGALVLGLEIDMISNYPGEDGSQIMSINADYKTGVYAVGLTYESFSDLTADAENATSRMSLHGSMDVVENGAGKVRFEYSSVTNDEDDTYGGSFIGIGFLGVI
jgi:hypothetical protein